MEKQFTIRLKELRKQHKLTQKELAEALNVKDSTINRYEKGVNEPSFEMFYALALYFNVTTDYLLGVEHVETKEAAPEFNQEQLQVVELIKKLNSKELGKVYNYLLGIIDARN